MPPDKQACPHPWKDSFDSKREAMESKRKRGQRKRPKSKTDGGAEAYKCRCRKWHLGHPIGTNGGNRQ